MSSNTHTLAPLPPPPSAEGEPLIGQKLRVLVTGGGTGGHTTPAVATIQALRVMADSRPGEMPFSGIEFIYVGSKTGVEGEIAREMGVEFVGIETGKLRRSRSIIGLLSLANLLDAFRVPVGYTQALRAVRRLQPDVALSTGGYVSVPAVLACAALRILVVAHEQTVQVGLANRINFRFASKIALSVAESLEELTAAQRSRAVVTGNPVRQVIFGGDRERAVSECGFSAGDGDLPTVYATGGAQGSRLLNEAVGAALPAALEHCRMIHQCGNEQDFEMLTAKREAMPVPLQRRYAVRRYIGDEIGDVYALADLIVGRSGAGTVAEACALGKPCVFVPLVPTGGNEQWRNARRMAAAGAARVVPQDSLSASTLTEAVLPLLADAHLLAQMGRAALKLATPNAARDVAELVIQAARRPV